MATLQPQQRYCPPPAAFKYFLVLFIGSLILMGVILQPFLPILVLSFLLTSIFRPLFFRLSKKIKPWFASTLICLIIIIVVFVPITFFVGALSGEAYDLYLFGKGANLGAKLQTFLKSNALFQSIIGHLAQLGVDIGPEEIGANIAGFAKTAGLFMYNQASAWAANVMSFFFYFFMMIIVIYFLLIDHERLMEFIFTLSPMPDQQERLLFERFEKIGRAILIGNGVSGLVQGTLGGGLFVILGLNSPLLWGAIMAILAFLPIFGAGLVMIPTIVWLFLTGVIGKAVIALVFYILVTVLLEYLMKPKLVGNQVQMHTLLVFLAVLGGLSVFGVLGIVYGPIIATAFLSLADIYREQYRQFVACNMDGKVLKENGKDGRGERI